MRNIYIPNPTPPIFVLSWNLCYVSICDNVPTQGILRGISGLTSSPTMVLSWSGNILYVYCHLHLSCCRCDNVEPRMSVELSLRAVCLMLLVYYVYHLLAFSSIPYLLCCSCLRSWFLDRFDVGRHTSLPFVSFSHWVDSLSRHLPDIQPTDICIDDRTTAMQPFRKSSPIKMCPSFSTPKKIINTDIIIAHPEQKTTGARRQVQ